MFSLVYRSKASSSFSGSAVTEMLKKARAYNQSEGITGCLLYYKDEFIQYLEGNQFKVLRLFDKISEDRRHSDIALLSYAETDKRNFDKWEMAYEDLHGENDQLQFIKLLVSSYVDDAINPMDPNPTSVKFWKTVRSLLDGKPA